MNTKNLKCQAYGNEFIIVKWESEVGTTNNLKIELKSNLNVLEKILDVQFLSVYALTRYKDVCK